MQKKIDFAFNFKGLVRPDNQEVSMYIITIITIYQNVSLQSSQFYRQPGQL